MSRVTPCQVTQHQSMRKIYSPPADVDSQKMTLAKPWPPRAALEAVVIPAWSWIPANRNWLRVTKKENNDNKTKQKRVSKGLRTGLQFGENHGSPRTETASTIPLPSQPAKAPAGTSELLSPVQDKVQEHLMSPAGVIYRPLDYRTPET